MAMFYIINRCEPPERTTAYRWWWLACSTPYLRRQAAAWLRLEPWRRDYP
jgi:hypothetical protein